MALRSLAGKLRPPVAATLRPAPASRSFHPEDKLSRNTNPKIKPLTFHNAEEDAHIMFENIKERARVVAEPMVAFRRRQNRIMMMAAASGCVVGTVVMEERNPRARQAPPSRDLDAQQPEAIGMAMALRSLVGKLRPPVAATLRRAPPSRSFHPEEKLTKTPVEDNCFEEIGDKYFEERSRIFSQLVKEDARRTEELIAVNKKQKRVIVASTLGAAVGIYVFLIKYD
uniref:Uncharacterized protein n=1 Tax=Oryza punctata TaxID=4537 RepID=A0A0E0LGP9_ORYPU